MTTGTSPHPADVTRSVATLTADPDLPVDLIGAQLSASEHVGVW